MKKELTKEEDELIEAIRMSREVSQTATHDCYGTHKSCLMR